MAHGHGIIDVAAFSKCYVTIKKNTIH